MQALMLVRLVVCFLLLIFGMHAAEAAKITMSRFPPNPGVLPGGGWRFTPGTTFGDPPPPRQWVDGVYGGVRYLIGTDAVPIAGRAGALVVQAAQALTVAEAAAVVARCLGNPLCVGASAAVAAAAAALYDRYGVRPNGTDGLDLDPGQGQQDVETWKVGESIGSSPTAAYSAHAQKFFNDLQIGSDLMKTKLGSPTCNSSPPNYNCSGFYVRRTYWPDGAFHSDVQITGTATRTVVKQCPAVINFHNPAYLIPGGPLRPDGKCPTGTYSAPISYEEAWAKVAANPPPAESNQLRDAVKHAIDTGGMTAPAEITSSGPASQLGTPSSTTTTTPQGTTTTTTQPRYDYSYNGDTITYQTTNITNTCAGAGSCSSENADTSTEKTTAPPTEGDPEDPCTAAPDRAGCVKLGAAPPQDPLKEKEIPVSVTAQGGFGADNGSCPAPIYLQSVGLVDPYALVCTYMSGIRFAVIGVAWLMAALIFLGRVD